MRYILFLMAALCLQFSYLQGEESAGIADEIDFNDSLILGELGGEYEIEKLKVQMLLKEAQIDSALIIASELIQKAEMGLFPPEQVVDAYKTMGVILLHLNLHGLAERYLDKAHNLYTDYHFKPSRYSANIYSIRATQYINDSEDFPIAIRYYKKAKGIYSDLENYLYEASLINNIGYVYLMNNRLDSAKFYFEKAKIILKEHKVPFGELILSINDNLGDVAYRRQKYETSFEFYELNYQLAHNVEIPTPRSYDRIIASSIGKTKVSIAMGNYELCEAYLAEAEMNLDFIENNFLLDKSIEIQSLKGLVYMHLGDIDAFSKSIETKNALIEKKHKIELDAQTLVTGQLVEQQFASFNLQLKAHLVDIALARAEKKLSMFIALGLFVLLSVSGVLSVLLVRRRTDQRDTQRKLVSANLLNQELKEEKMQFELQNQEKDLNELSAYALLLRKVAEEAGERLKSLKTLNDIDREDELNALSMLFAQEVNNNKAQAIIQSNLHLVNASFFKSLDACSETLLSKKEKELCALFRLNLSDEQIAEINLISVNAIQVARHRIKKKIGLNKKDDITVFLTSIVPVP